MVSISFRNTFDADDDPVEVVAEKMFICDADVHNLPEPERKFYSLFLIKTLMWPDLTLI